MLCGCFSAAGNGRLVRIQGMYREILDENLLQNNNPNHTAKTKQEWIRYNSLNVLEWSSQNQDLNLIEHLWRDLKIAVQQHSQSNLTELERICREECEKRPKYRCAKLVEPNIPVIAAKDASTKY